METITIKNQGITNSGRLVDGNELNVKTFMEFMGLNRFASLEEYALSLLEEPPTGYNLRDPLERILETQFSAVTTAREWIKKYNLKY